MNQYGLLCLDIDGTILNSKHEITEKTKTAINKAVKEKKIPVVLVSARMPKGIVFLAKELGLCAPIICYSGALILDENEKILLSNYMPVSSVQKIYSIVKEYGVHISLYKDDEWYIEKMDQWAAQEKEITNISPCINNYQELFTCWEQEKTGCNKILCIGEPTEIALLKKKLEDICQGQVNIYLSKPTYLEIMPKNSSKTSAITRLLEKYNLDETALIAIGDNYNDIDMIKYAGVGIAMGNAPDQVKRCANDVTLSNDEDGVAYAINKYILV